MIERTIPREKRATLRHSDLNQHISIASILSYRHVSTRSLIESAVRDKTKAGKRGIRK
jgi:hypothetical protein